LRNERQKEDESGREEKGLGRQIEGQLVWQSLKHEDGAREECVYAAGKYVSDERASLDLLASAASVEESAVLGFFTSLS
jgi:hypothetical protein